MKSINRGFAESQVQLLKDGVINVFRLIENFRLEGAVECLLAQMVFTLKQPSWKILSCVAADPRPSLPQNLGKE